MKNVISKAKIACESSDHAVSNHVGKTIKMPRRGTGHNFICDLCGGEYMSRLVEDGDILLFKDGTFFFVDETKLKGWSGYVLQDSSNRMFKSYTNDIHLVFKGYKLEEIESMNEIIECMLDEDMLLQIRKREGNV